MQSKSMQNDEEDERMGDVGWEGMKPNCRFREARDGIYTATRRPRLIHDYEFSQWKGPNVGTVVAAKYLLGVMQ